MYIASFLKLDWHVELLHFYFFFSLTETQISCFEFINRWKSYFISFEACARPHKMKSSIPPKYQLCVLGPGRRGCRLEGQLQPHTSLVPVSGGQDGEVWILVVQSTSALSPDWQGRRSNEISRHIEVVKSKPKRRRCPVVVWMTSCTNSWSLANIWKNVDQQSVWELHSGWSPSQNILLLTMWQLERLGSGCSPPRLLLLVYTYLCAVGGEFPFSECLIRGAVPFVGVLKSSQQRRQHLILSLASIQSPKHPQLLLSVAATDKTVFLNTDLLRLRYVWGRMLLIMAHNALSEAPIGCRLRYGGLNVVTRKPISPDVLTLVTFHLFSFCGDVKAQSQVSARWHGWLQNVTIVMG